MGGGGEGCAAAGELIAGHQPQGLEAVAANAPGAASSNGWTVDLVECLMAEYRMCLREAVRFPLSAITALLPSRAGRAGHRGPTHSDRCEGQARLRARAWLEHHFAIVPDAEYIAAASAGLPCGPAGLASSPDKP